MPDYAAAAGPVPTAVGSVPAAAATAGAVSSASPATAPAPGTASGSLSTAPAGRGERDAPLPLPANCALGQTMSLTEAIGRPVTDVPTLRFVSLFRSMSVDRLAAAAASRYDAALQRRIVSATKDACSGAASSVAATRAFVIATSFGGLRLAAAGKTALLNNLFYATAALAAGDRLSSDDVGTALAPFGTNYSILAIPDATSPIPSTCPHPNVDARVVDKVNPGFPQAEFDRGDSDVITVRFSLDPHGFIVYARPADPPAFGDANFVSATLVAAEASVFDPARKACAPVGGTYDFIGNFRSS